MHHKAEIKEIFDWLKTIVNYMLKLAQ